MTGQSEPFDNSQRGQTPQGEVYRRRYTRYTGGREGRARTYLAVIIHSARRALGIRRKWTAKILPIILYGAAFIPIIGFISVPAILGIEGLEFDTTSAFTSISLILLVFAAAAAPEMLCDDRRENVLPLYYSRGLSRWDYLAAKLLALGALMLSISLLPALLLFLGNTFLQDSPLSHLRSNAVEVPQIFATAIVLSTFYAAIGLAVSALTERKGIASAIYIGIFIAGSAIANGLFEAIDQAWSDYFAAVALMEIADGILLLIFNEVPSQSLPVRAGIEPIWYLVSVIGVVLVSAAILYRRYLRED